MMFLFLCMLYVLNNIENLLHSITAEADIDYALAHEVQSYFLIMTPVKILGSGHVSRF